MSHWHIRLVAVASAAAALLGCSSPEAPVDPQHTSAASPTAAAMPTVAAIPTPTGSPAAEAAIAFVYAAPESPCLPASALPSLPLAAEMSYVLARAKLVDGTASFGRLRELCSYQRAEWRDGTTALILEEHAIVSARISLYREWEDWPNAVAYPALPLTSQGLDDWSAAVVASRDTGVRQEGCGQPPRDCADGEEPTVQIHGWHNWFLGHVGNLEFDVDISYFAERVPHNVEQRNIEIFRDYVLAVVDSKERAQ